MAYLAGSPALPHLMEIQHRIVKALRAVSDGIRDLLDVRIINSDGHASRVPNLWSSDRHIREYWKRNDHRPLIRVDIREIKTDPILPDRWAVDFDIQFYTFLTEDENQMFEQLTGILGYENRFIDQKDGKAANVFLKHWDPKEKLYTVRALMDYKEVA